MSATTTGTTSESKKKKETSNLSSVVAIPSSVLEPPSQSSKGESAASKTYLRDVAEHLLTWMKRMEAEEVSPANVNAMCNIAQQVANVVKVNIELKKCGL